MEQSDLMRMLDWTKGKLATGEEPPWAWYQYMKLRETLEAILAGMDAVTTDHSPQSEERQEKHLRLVESNDPQDNTPHRPAGLPIQTPM